MGVFPRWSFVILGVAWALVQAVAGATLHAQDFILHAHNSVIT